VTEILEKQMQVENVKPDPVVERPVKKKSETKSKLESESSEDDKVVSERSESDSDDDFKKKPKNSAKKKKPAEKSSKTEKKFVEPPPVENKVLAEKTNNSPEAKVVVGKLEPPKPVESDKPVKSVASAVSSVSSKTNLLNKFSSHTPTLNNSLTNKPANPGVSTTPLGRIEIRTPSPAYRVGLSRNSKVKPLHPNVKPA
jgi:hypothetical protein